MEQSNKEEGREEKERREEKSRAEGRRGGGREREEEETERREGMAVEWEGEQHRGENLEDDSPDSILKLVEHRVDPLEQ